MSNPTPQLIQKLWNYCNVLRDDGLSYGDYVERLLFLPFLRMADEQSLKWVVASTVRGFEDQPNHICVEALPDISRYIRKRLLSAAGKNRLISIKSGLFSEILDSAMNLEVVSRYFQKRVFKQRNLSGKSVIRS